MLVCPGAGDHNELVSPGIQEGEKDSPRVIPSLDASSNACSLYVLRGGCSILRRMHLLPPPPRVHTQSLSTPVQAEASLCSWLLISQSISDGEVAEPEARDVFPLSSHFLKMLLARIWVADNRMTPTNTLKCHCNHVLHFHILRPVSGFPVLYPCSMQ